MYNFKGGININSLIHTYEKTDIFKEFFEIEENKKLEDLLKCRDKCKLYLSNSSDNNDIKDLINVIEAGIVYFGEEDKEKAIKYVLDLWYRLYNKDSLNINEIRILNFIMFASPSIEKVIETAEDLSIQLERYKDDKSYVKVKSYIKLNLAVLLFDAKHFDISYKSYYDQIILQALDEIIDLNIKSRENNRYIVGLACIKRGALLKDRNLIYVGVLLLNQIGREEDVDLIKAYVRNYNIAV